MNIADSRRQRRLRAWADRKLARRSPRAVYRRGMRLGVGLVVAMGILALISSGVVDNLRGQVETLISSPSAVGAQRVVSADVSGRAHVLDGDTIEVGGVRVRLEGLHCPEGNEPGGSAATIAMRDLSRGQHVSCSLTGERSYDRLIGTCYVGDINLTAGIIRQGVCARCPRYDRSERYLPAQRDADPWRGSMPRYCR